MRVLGIVVLCAALGGCAASREEDSVRLGEHYIGQNVDALVIDFGLPASTFKMNSGDTSYIWQLGNQTNAVGGNGAAIASTRFCKVSAVASKTGIVTLLIPRIRTPGLALPAPSACTAAPAQIG